MGTRKEGPEEVSGRKLLEEALSYVMGPAQAGPAVENLVDRFGSFAGVFLAPEEEISLLLGPEAARYLRLTTGLARTYLEDNSRDLKRVYDTKTAVELFRPRFLGRQTEAVCLLLLDGRGRLLYNDILSEGSVSAVPIYIRKLLQLCILYDAQHVMLAHNHPSGNAGVSRNDLVATHQVEMALESIDATLNDHIIFSGEDYNSFARNGWLRIVRENVRQYRRQVTESARSQEQIVREDGSPGTEGKK